MRDDIRGESPAGLNSAAADGDDGPSLLEMLVPLVEHWKLLVFGPVLAALTGLGVAFLLPHVYTARTVFLPPQQQQSGAATLQSLGALGGLPVGSGLKTPADQYVALMRSATIEDRIVEQFGLLQVYDREYRTDARKVLHDSTRMSVGKKDGLVSIEVDDREPKRAAAIANAYVEELRRMTSVLAVSEAQQRRVFFEKHLQDTRDRLADAQRALQASGISQGALKAEPRTAAEGYAKLRAEATAAEVRLQALRGALHDTAPEIQQQQATLSALRAQLARVERAGAGAGDPDYVGRYREFKYQETLFDLFARQYELARVDESREGQLIQVVDPAVAPEKKSKPKRLLIGIGTGVAAFLLLAAAILMRQSWRNAEQDPHRSDAVRRLRQALGRDRHSDA